MRAGVTATQTSGGSWELAVEVLGISCQLMYPRGSHSPVLDLRAQAPSLLFPVEDPEIPNGLQLPPLATGSVSGSHRVTRHLKGKGLIVVEGEYEVHLAT